MSWHTPERKTEQALKLYFQTVLGYELDGVQIATRFSNTDLTEPRIDIFCESASPYPSEAEVHTGNWLVTVKIEVVSHYASGTDAVSHDEICGHLLDKLIMIDDVTGADVTVDQINATQFEEEFTIQFLEIKDRTNRIEEHSLVTEQEIEMIISPSRL